MGDLRRILTERRWLAIGLVLAALCMKALLPAGFMLAPHTTVLTVEVCSDASGEAGSRQIAIPQKTAPGEENAAGKVDGNCPYSALSLAGLSGADPLLLALALAFILVIGFLPVRPRAPQPAAHLRPPLRGPPTYA